MFCWNSAIKTAATVLLLLFLCGKRAMARRGEARVRVTECFLDDLCAGVVEPTMNGWACLREVPPQCSRLNLRGNGIDNVGAEALAEALRDNGLVKMVKLGHNVIGDAGVSALASSLARNTSVQTLYVINPAPRQVCLPSRVSIR